MSARARSAETLPRLMARLMTYLRLHAEAEHYKRALLAVEVDRIRVRV
jgi:hypothetical protein